MADVTCRLCAQQTVEAYYGGIAVCAECVESIVTELGCDCGPDFHELAQYCETRPSDVDIASMVASRLRDLEQTRTAGMQGKLIA